MASGPPDPTMGGGHQEDFAKLSRTPSPDPDRMNVTEGTGTPFTLTPPPKQGSTPSPVSDINSERIGDAQNRLDIIFNEVIPHSLGFLGPVNQILELVDPDTYSNFLQDARGHFKSSIREAVQVQILTY